MCKCVVCLLPLRHLILKEGLIHLFINVSYTSRPHYEVRRRLLRKLPTPGVVEFWSSATIVPSFLATEQQEFRCRKCVISMVQNTACPTFGSTTYRHFRPELKAAVLVHMFHAAQCDFQYKYSGCTDNIIR
jgi:hypothetical protein